MSTSVTATGYGLVPTLIANAGTVHAQLDTLTEQASTGLISQTYAGLGSGAQISLALSPKISSLQTYSANVDQATGQMQVAQTAMNQLQQIAQTFAGQMPILDGLNPSEADTIAANARDALSQVADLLDTQDGGVYVFGGQDTGNPPVPNPDQILSSGFYTQINTAIRSLSSAGASTTLATTMAVAQSNTAGTSPFSDYMSQPVASIAAPIVQTGDNTFTSTGLLASGNSVAISNGGTATTGSYVRDLMRSLATLGSLSSSQVGDPNFASVVSDTTTSLNSSISAMATDMGVLGDRQNTLTSVKTHLGDLTTALTGQVSSAQDVDMAAVISKLTSLQTQLQESYKLIVSTGSLSLVNFVPA